MVIVAGHDRTVLVQKHHAVDVKALGTALIGEGCGHLLVLLQFYLLGVGVVGLVRTAYLLYAHGHVGNVLLCPCRSGHIVGDGGRNQVPVVLVVAGSAHGVVGSGSFQTCEYLVAHDHLAAGIADGGGLAAGCLGIHVVGHGNDVEHVHVALAKQFHLGAQIMASVAQYCTPEDLYLLTLVGVAEDCLQSLAGIVLGTTDGSGVGGEVLLLETLHLHLAGGNLLACTEANDEEFCACHQVHGLAAQEVDALVALQETGGQNVVVQGINLTLLLAHGNANGILLLGIYPCLGVCLAAAKFGHVVVGNGNSLGLVVHINHGKLALLLGSHNIAGREMTGNGNRLAVGVLLAVDGHAALLQHDGVGVDLHFSDNPTAAGILACALLPQADCYGGVVQSVLVLASVPVHVLCGGSS